MRWAILSRFRLPNWLEKARGVMLPAFSGISDDVERRERAYLRSMQLVSLICMPACILLAPAAPALVRLILSREWDSSARLMQIFLLTMGFAVTGGIAVMTIQSRGLYKWCLAITGIDAILFVAVVWPVAALYDIIYVALSVSIVYAVFGTVHPIIASLPSSRATKWRILEAIVAPFVLAVVEPRRDGWWLAAWISPRRICDSELFRVSLASHCISVCQAATSARETSRWQRNGWETLPCDCGENKHY